MTVNYTIEDADKTVLYRASRYSDGPDVTLWDVYNKFEMGQSLGEISQDLPDVPKNKLLFARAFFASVNPQAYASSTISPLKVLVDENVDPHIVTDTAREVFGHATHVSFVGLAFKRDVDVYAFALRQRYNLIISKDLALIKSRATWDLTRCAHEFFQWRLNAGNNTTGEYIAQLPRILHVIGANLSGEDIARNLQNNCRDVAAIFDEASSPTIQLHRDEAKPGKHF
jgi:predicted nuclease of predicted toxin-antitoxin system